jgi:hypothetical protein
LFEVRGDRVGGRIFADRLNGKGRCHCSKRWLRASGGVWSSTPETREGHECFHALH